MLAIAVHALEHAAHFLRDVAINAVEDEFRIPQYRIQRGAEFMAHVGQELGLVLARDFELMALIMHFVEQPRVLDREHGLSGEGLQQVDGSFGKFSGHFAAYDEGAYDLIGTEQRNEDAGEITCFYDDFL